jgi:hypothetical protein
MSTTQSTISTLTHAELAATIRETVDLIGKRNADVFSLISPDATMGRLVRHLDDLLVEQKHRAGAARRADAPSKTPFLDAALAGRLATSPAANGEPPNTATVLRFAQGILREIGGVLVLVRDAGPVHLNDTERQALSDALNYANHAARAIQTAIRP